MSFVLTEFKFWSHQSNFLFISGSLLWCSTSQNHLMAAPINLYICNVSVQGFETSPLGMYWLQLKYSTYIWIKMDKMWFIYNYFLSEVWASNCFKVYVSLCFIFLCFASIFWRKQEQQLQMLWFVLDLRCRNNAVTGSFIIFQGELRSFTYLKVAILQCRNTLLQVKLLHSKVTKVQAQTLHKTYFSTKSKSTYYAE